MTAIMSFQYPPPPAPDVNVSSSLMNTYLLPPPNISQAFQKPSPTRRGSAGLLKTGKMKRSSSSPNIRGQARADQTDAAIADEKRRNKLGYHRTSVACGHCRRRKIRCILAPGDPHNRCSNCIRLKKECHFHPVDQQAESGSAQRRNSHAQGSTPRLSSASPSNPALPKSDIKPFSSYPHLPMPLLNDAMASSAKRPRTDSFSPEGKGPLDPGVTEFSHQNATWMPGDSVPVSKAASEASAAYWRLNSHESSLPPVFSPYGSNVQLHHHSPWSQSHAESTARDDVGWTVPQRSMAYGGHELPHHSPYPAFHHPLSDSNAREDFSQRPPPHNPDPYGPTMTSTSGSNSAGGVSMSSVSNETTPQSSGPPPLPPPFPNSQGWQPYPYKVSALPSSSEPYTGWYGPSSTLSSQSHNGPGLPPVTYSQVDPYGSVYYPTTSQGGR